MAEVKLGGIWLHSLGYVSELKWSTVWGAGPCGSDLASCTLAVDPSNDSPLLRLNQTFEVWDGGVKVFGGMLSEMGRDYPRTLSAKGWAKRASDFDAVDGSGNPAQDLKAAVGQAITNGLPWTNVGAFPSFALSGEAASAAQRLDSVLTDWASASAKRWGVDVEGAAFTSSDPTTPTWYLDASDLDIGIADDGLYTRVRARYVSSVDPTTGDPVRWAAAVADDALGQSLYGVIEYAMDLTQLGLIAGNAAYGFAQAQLALLTVPQWLSRVTTNSSRLLTKGGLGAYLPSVRAGQMVRLFNVPTGLGGLRNELGLDVVLGEVEYDTGSPGEVTIAPVGLAVRNLADLAAQAAETAKNKRGAAA